MKLNVVESSSSEPWYADGLRFTCTQCGNCCTGGPGYVWISREEIDRLAAFLNLSARETIERHCRRLGARYSLNEHRNAAGLYDCTFLREVKVKGPPAPGEGTTAGALGSGGGQEITHTRRQCSIYPVRPLQCRTWPFWDGNLQSPEIWEHSAVRCHGMNRGKKYSRERIEELRDAPDWPDKPPTSGGPTAGGMLNSE